ncbi:hypothetical protein R5R35_003338 [Gryllus longicercus]|uniref:GDNF/GAS1 domain-containing protein n=1 Tax=Gryllus longicercus TaxID=2509291 RepID=A0AAN9VL14_9ORTH
MFPWAAAVAALLCSLLPGPSWAWAGGGGRGLALSLGPAPALALVAATAAATASTSSSPSSPASSCEHARLKCAFRTGCGRALQNYMVSCSTALQRPSPGAAAGDGPNAACPEHCQHALIALTSTDEGKDLMTCKCGDDYCEETKKRVEVCRPHVEQAMLNTTIVSCRLAQWICKADAECSMALDYYHRFCRSMFQGKKCSRRCNNSISILQRQEKAAKLISCRCDARDDSDCAQNREKMVRLCFPGGETGGFGGGGGGGGGAGAGLGAGHQHPGHPGRRPPGDDDPLGAAADAPAAAAGAAAPAPAALSLVLGAAALALLAATRRLPQAT